MRFRKNRHGRSGQKNQPGRRRPPRSGRWRRQPARPRPPLKQQKSPASRHLVPVVEEPLAAPTAEAPPVEEPPATPTARPVPLERAATVGEEAVDTSLVLEIEAIDSTWVQIRGDGRNLFEGTAAPGIRRRWQVRDHFLVRSGRAHGLRYWFRGELLGDGRLGDPLKVLRFRASRAGVTLLGADLEPLPPAPSLAPAP